MIVSMLMVVLELPDMESLKDKRRIVHGLRDRVIRKFHVSAAEVDLHESLTFAQIGVALVSNDKQHGERVMQKVLAFVEHNLPGRLQDVQTHTEIYD